MATPRYEELLDIVACEITARPVGAPGIEPLLAALTGSRRTPGTLTLVLGPGNEALARAFVDAERVCCSTLEWGTDGRTITISAAPTQLDALEAAFLPVS
jgi:hypothetical protein